MVPPLCALIIQNWGWHQIFYFFAIPGIILGVAWYFIVPDKPAQCRFCSPAEAEYIETGKTSVAGAVKERKPYKLVWLDKIVRAKKLEKLDTTFKLFTSWNLVGSALGYFFMVAITTTMMSLASHLSGYGKETGDHEDGVCRRRTVCRNRSWQHGGRLAVG